MKKTGNQDLVKKKLGMDCQMSHEELQKKREKLEQFTVVKQWKESRDMNARKGQISEKTWRKLLMNLDLYVGFVGMNPTELIHEGKSDPDKGKKRLLSWFTWLLEDYPRELSRNSAIIYLANLRGFYTHNRVSFGKWRFPQFEVPATTKIDEQVDIFKYDEENGEIFVDTGLLQQFLGQLSFRDQTIALALLSTSQDASDLLKLKMGWLRVQEKEKRLFWHGNRSKTGEEFKVYFTQEATDMIRRYVDQERDQAGDQEPIWILSRMNTKVQPMNTENVEVKPMNTELIKKAFRKAALTMKLTGAGIPNPFRPKRFRHLFRNACTSAGIGDGIAKAFMGHKSDVSSGYLSRAKSWLLSQYVKVEPFLTVMRSKGELEIGDIKTDLESAHRERDHVKGRVLELETTITHLKEELTLLAGVVRDIATGKGSFEEITDIEKLKDDEKGSRTSQSDEE